MDEYNLELDGLTLCVKCSLVPWDAAVFGFRVAQINTLTISDTTRAALEYRAVTNWLDEMQIKIASCRLAHDRLRESMFLEEQGFRFVEMVLHPRIERLDQHDLPEDNLTIAQAEEADVAALKAVAEQVFGYERYHIDPRLDSNLADQRYGQWVKNSYSHPRQRLLKILDADRLVAFFIIENKDDGGAYWHLTAVAPEYQGQGYGRRVWRAILRLHRAEGVEYVTTTISARNVPVLNLYARLGFNFLPPEMTFHWVRPN